MDLLNHKKHQQIVQRSFFSTRPSLLLLGRSTKESECETADKKDRPDKEKLIFIVRIERPAYNRTHQENYKSKSKTLCKGLGKVRIPHKVTILCS